MDGQEKAHNELFENQNIRYFLTNENGQQEGIKQFDFKSNQDTISNKKNGCSASLHNFSGDLKQPRTKKFNFKIPERRYHELLDKLNI